MDFDKISSKTFWGKFLRFPLTFIPPETVMPILRGKLKGKRWIVGSGTHGCWLGTYEYDKQHIFEASVKPGSIIFDIGAHAGFYTLLASVLVGANGKVFAFEPLPRNLFYLKEHLRLNNITNVTVIEAAVSNFSGLTSFEESSTGYQGGITSQGKLQVNAVNLDELIARGEIPIPDYIKIDVEGHEKSVLVGAKSMLANAHPTIFLAIHGRPVLQQCRQLLESLGYKLKALDGNNLAQLPKNTEIIAYR